MRWLGVLAIAACSSRPRSDVVTPPAPDVEPELVIVSPDRGTFVDGPVVLSGRVRDDGPARVTVDGTPVAVAADGTFSVTLALKPGLAIVETHALDATGHDVRDVRSVLVGPFAASDGSARAEIAARIGARGLAVLGKALATSASAIDFTAVGRALNPVYDDDSCIGARVDIDTLTAGKIEVTLVPKPNAIETAVTVDDVVVTAKVRYKLACVDGSTTMRVNTKARVRGDLRLALAERRIRTSLPAPAVVLDGFRVDIEGVPGPIDRLVRGRIRSGVEKALVKAIETKLPALADAKLAELLARPATASLLGTELTVDVAPRKLELAASGLFVAADTTFVVAGGERGRYVATRASVAGVANERPDAGLWISTDALHQLLAGLWAARTFERSIARDDVGPLAMLLDEEVQKIDVSLSLPPTLRTDPALELAIGDLVITLRDGTGGELQRFAVSLRSALAIKPGALTTTEPTIYVQLLHHRATLARPLEAAAVEGLVKLAWAAVAARVDDALARVPIPDLGGLELAPARPGLIVLAVTVAR